jgi:hypothetical protein
MTTESTDTLLVLIDPERLQELIWQAYFAGCEAVHANYQPDPDPDFTEASYDYVASLDFTTETRPYRDADQLAETRERLERAEGVLTVIADGSVPPHQNGHYLAHRNAVNAARAHFTHNPVEKEKL